jgi:hypothetical protein
VLEPDRRIAPTPLVDSERQAEVERAIQINDPLDAAATCRG